MCPAQGHNAETPQTRAKHSTTEPPFLRCVYATLNKTILFSVFQFSLLKSSNCINENMSLICVFSTMKKNSGWHPLQRHTSQIKDYHEYTISEKIIIKTAALISKLCMQDRHISISYGKAGRNEHMIC